jgi:aminoglycoside adenylyltransferase-like protein
LLTSLRSNLVGAYLHGSIAFPEYNPRAGDIDFYVVVLRSVNRSEIGNLDRLHRSLAAKFEFGKKLDGFYIPYAAAQRRENPRNLVYGANGRIHYGGSDDAWALHREHFRRAAYIRLHGPRASRIFSRAYWPEIRSALYRQLVGARKIIDSDPWWSVLNLCRLIYNFEIGGVAVSKLGAARWALKRLPSRWKPVITSAVKTYKGIADGKDRIILVRDARKFLGFASIRVIAFDIASNSRGQDTAYLRKRRMRVGR